MTELFLHLVLQFYKSGHKHPFSLTAVVLVLDVASDHINFCVEPNMFSTRLSVWDTDPCSWGFLLFVLLKGVLDPTSEL